jgi:muramoyltetrapeptide carboxypeptidase
MLDYRLIRRNPKILVGYSDITALQLAIFTRSGLTSVSGAVVTELPLTFTPATEEMFWRALSSTRPLGIIRGSANPAFDSRKSSVRRGILVGGNLSLLAGLIGTSFFPQRKDLVLVLEEIDERPYRVDRTLQQMKLNGVLQRARGIVLGSFVDCTPVKGKASLRLNQVFEDTFRPLAAPVVSGIRYGHHRNSLTIPIGVKVLIDPRRNTVKFLESPLS